MTTTGEPAARAITTSTGRTVGCYEFGDPAGRPMFVLHGTPSSGAGFTWTDAAARERGVRVLAPDRPGIGLSTHTRLRAVADYPPELAATADALGIDRFAVVGYSGGGPYALASAHALGERVAAVAVVAGAGHVGEWASMREASPTDRQMTWFAIRVPSVARVALGSAARLARLAPAMALRSTRAELSATDLAVLDRLSRDEALAAFTEAFSGGARGVVDDYAALGRPWQFRVEDIVQSVALWHGTADQIVPIAHSRALAERLPRSALHVWPGEGHLAFITHVGDVLDALGEW